MITAGLFCITEQSAWTVSNPSDEKVFIMCQCIIMHELFYNKTVVVYQLKFGYKNVNSVCYLFNKYHCNCFMTGAVVLTVAKMYTVFNIPNVLPWKPPMKDKILSSGQPGA